MPMRASISLALPAKRVKRNSESESKQITQLQRPVFPVELKDAPVRIDGRWRRLPYRQILVSVCVANVQGSPRIDEICCRFL